MKNDNKNVLLDKFFKTVDELINYIDCKSTNKQQCRKLQLQGNEIDAFRLIKKYNLKDKENIAYDNYSVFKDFVRPNKKNSYIFSPVSRYGNKIIKLDIKGNLVEISFSPKAKIDNSFKSKNLKNFIDKDFVFLDIETTGLNFIKDDVIEFCIYENEEKYFRKYLPLENRKTNTAFSINKIEDEKLLKANPLTQEEVDYIIEKFDLINKVILIWTGNNLFDRTFLEIYFLKHNLKGIENFTFCNVEIYAKEKVPGLKSYSKDYIALLYGISTLNSHNALEDCIIEKKIINKLLNNTQILLDAREHYIKVKEFLMKANYNSLDAEKIYNEFCAFLYRKNGPVSNDYDKNPKTRGKEWIDIHHIDENIIDDIATRTNNAKENNDNESLKELERYNKKERLVFATKVEHFILHCLLDIIRECFSGGPHFLFGDLLKIETGIFENNTKEYNIQNGKSVFYKDITFFEIIEIYCKNLILNNANLENCAKDFYKLENYSFDNEKHDNIIERIKIEKRILEGNDKSN